MRQRFKELIKKAQEKKDASQDASLPRPHTNRKDVIDGRPDVSRHAVGTSDDPLLDRLKEFHHSEKIVTK